MIIHISVFGQKKVMTDTYYNVKNGVYKTKSLDKKLIGRNLSVIKPQTTIKNIKNPAFIKVKNKAIALFDRINDLGTTKPLGVLTKTSVVQVDTIFYKEIYKDATTKNNLTFNVWYAISINGKHYYTDYKIHDCIAYRQKIDNLNQEFLLISQSTGYDEYYDNGYQNYFFVAILNDNQELIYTSDFLDFDYGYEFYDESTVSTKITMKGLEFTIYGSDSEFKGIWTGKKLNIKHQLTK